MALKDHQYSNATLDFQLLIDGEDVSAYVADIPSISKSADIERIHEYRVGEMTALLNDPEGYFAPANDANFFVGQSKIQSGLGVSCELKLRYDTDTLETFWTGEIIEINQEMSANTAQTRIVFSDQFHKLFTSHITDFGLEKQFRIIEDPESEKNINGRYPLPEFIPPVSIDSTELKKSVNETLTEVPELAERGALNPDNYVVSDDAVETEGGAIDNPSTGYPQLKAKTPYRHIPVKSVIEKVLAEVGITQKDILIQDESTDIHFSTKGRPGYEVVGQALFGTSQPVSWQGFVTDVLYDNGVWYYLYSVPRDDVVNRSILMSYTVSTDAWTVLWRAPQIANARTELWKMAKSGTDMFILCTDAAIVGGIESDMPDIAVPADGSYDATETGNRVYILKRDLTLAVGNATTSVVVAKNASIKAQLAHRYLLGSTKSDFRSVDSGSAMPVQRPPVMLPDSRRKLIVYGTDLYFCAVSSGSVGVAKVPIAGGNPTWVERISQDDKGNQAGFFFDILGSRLFCAGTFKGRSNSIALAWTKNL